MTSGFRRYPGSTVVHFYNPYKGGLYCGRDGYPQTVSGNLRVTCGKCRAAMRQPYKVRVGQTTKTCCR